MSLLVSQSIDRIRAYADHAKLRPAAYAKKAGLSVNALARMHDDGWNPSSETLRKAEAVIPADFFPSDLSGAA